MGFVATGESVHAIQGERIDFIDMVLTRKQFIDPASEESE